MSSQEASDPQPVDVDSDSEPLRVALESSALKYIQAHYQEGVASVFSSTEANQYTVQIVSNKYNPTNYWCVVSPLYSDPPLMVH